MCIRDRKNPLLAGEILLLSGLTDLADGYIARRFHRISNLGKILDPVADKLTQAAMLICLFTRFPHVLLLIVIMAGKELYMVCLLYTSLGLPGDLSSSSRFVRVAFTKVNAMSV